MDVVRRSEGGGGRVGLAGVEALGARLSGNFFSSFADIRCKL